MVVVDTGVERRSRRVLKTELTVRGIGECILGESGDGYLGKGRGIRWGLGGYQVLERTELESRIKEGEHCYMGIGRVLA